MMKHKAAKVLSILLVLVMAAGLFPTAALAASGDVAVNAANFPDANFRAVVSNFDTNHDDTLSKSELSEVKSIECGDKDIASLKGVEYFTALQTLSCVFNQLTALDVSKNTALKEVRCSFNQLTALDVSKNTALNYLQCHDNQLTKLDVSKNTALETLYCDNNKLTALDVSKNAALKELHCSGNQLTKLDVSKNVALEFLGCSNNQLIALDVSKNPKLDQLSCANNQLKSLNLGKASNLRQLFCENNQLTELDLSNVPNVVYAVKVGNVISKNESYDEYWTASNNVMLLSVDKGVNIITESAETPTTTPDSPEPSDPPSSDPKPSDIKPDDTKPADPKPVDNPFVDVKNGDYFFDPVLWALNHQPQITDGTSETTFSPADTCTRGQVVTFLWRAMGCAEPTKTDNPFSDVTKDDYFYKAVLWAVEKGVTDGTSATTFSPADPCTRAHVVTFLCRAEGNPKGGANNPFADVASGEYYTDAVLWAVEKGITDGTSETTFSPADPCTRGQIVTFLYRDMK